MATAGSGITHREKRYARAIDNSDRGLEVRHLRLFLAEVDKAGLSDETRVRLKDELQPSSSWHSVEIEATAEFDLELPDGLYPAAANSDDPIPRYAQLDIWLTLGREAGAFESWRADRSFGDAWAELTAAVRESHDSHSGADRG